MSLTNAKHIIGEIDGIRCTIIETGISSERLSFLKDLLEFNKFEVRVKEETSEVPGDAVKFTLGVTDVIFNPVFAIYERSLKTKEGQIVSPSIWKQETTEYLPMYWMEEDIRNFPISSVK
jgi:hypothetical protein